MGIEAFGVSIQIVEPKAWEKLKDILDRYPNICMGNTEASDAFETVTGEYNDEPHFIEMQLSREVASDKCQLAVRFSLCSYGTIDNVFIELVSEILSSFEAEVWLMTSAVKQKTHYLPGDSGWLMNVLPDEIVEMRKYWQNLFGTKQGAVRVKDSFSFVGITTNG
jgi:hypothetical protein